jgi:hypothetical protein
MSVRTPRRNASHEPAVRKQGWLGIRLRWTPARFPWRLASLALVTGIIVGIIIFFASPAFYVSRAEIGGLRYVPAEEVFGDAGIAGYHVLWIVPREVADRIEASPSIESAEVYLSWPARVVIVVREREPAIVWEQGGARYWVDGRGHLMILRRDLPSLVRVINEGEAIPFHCPGPLCSEQDEIAIDPQVVLGTQHLKTLRSNIDVLYYNPARGLSYQDGRGWRGYFGVGANMDVKLVIYEQLVDSLLARGVRPVYIDVSNPDAPFYRVAQ